MSSIGRNLSWAIPAAGNVPASAFLAVALGWPLADMAWKSLDNALFPPAFIVAADLMREGADRFALGLTADWRLPTLTALTTLVAMIGVWPAAHILARARSPWVAIVVIGVGLPMLLLFIFQIEARILSASRQALAGADPVSPAILRRLTFWLAEVQNRTRSALPMAILIVLAGYLRMNPVLDRTAMSLGAGRWMRLRLVTWPLLRPWLLGAWVTMTIAAGAWGVFLLGSPTAIDWLVVDMLLPAIFYVATYWLLNRAPNTQVGGTDRAS